jgi:excisionase family DNA binding protein
MKPESSETLETYLTYQQIAHRLNIPLRTLYLYNKEGKAPATVKVGRHFRVSEEALAVWITQNTN